MAGQSFQSGFTEVIPGGPNTPNIVQVQTNATPQNENMVPVPIRNMKFAEGTRIEFMQRIYVMPPVGGVFTVARMYARQFIQKHPPGAFQYASQPYQAAPVAAPVIPDDMVVISKEELELLRKFAQDQLVAAKAAEEIKADVPADEPVLADVLEETEAEAVDVAAEMAEFEALLGEGGYGGVEDE